MNTNNISIKLGTENTVEVTLSGETRTYAFAMLCNEPMLINTSALPPCKKSYNLAVGYWLGCTNEDGSFLDVSSFAGVWLH